MNVVTRWCLSIALIVTAFNSKAADPGSECLTQALQVHVREQFALYGPRSANHEYFGFIYMHEGVIASAVTQSRECHGAKCVVDSSTAAQLIPKGATVLGEWHTHPHGGSPSLSKEDVRGAYSNRHISCYLAFYSTPSGEIYAWNPNRVSVPIAMASRAGLGNYKTVAASGP